MAKRVRIFGPGMPEAGMTVRKDDLTRDEVAAFLRPGLHTLDTAKGEVFWHGGEGCPFLFRLEEYDPTARPRAMSF